MKQIEIKKITQELLSYAIPLSISSLVVAFASLVNTRIMAGNKMDLYIFSIFAPVSYFIISFQESLRGAAMMISSHHRLIENIQMTLLKMLGITIVLGSIFAIVLNILSDTVLTILHVNPLYINHFQLFLKQIARVSFLLISVSVVLNAFIIGLGFKKAGLLFSVMNSVITSVSFYLLINYFNMNIHGLVIAFEISGILLCPAMIYFLFKQKIFIKGYFKVNKSDLKIIFGSINKISLPLFFSYLVIFGGLIAYNSILSNYNVDILSGYYVSYRLQTFIIFPAISMGSAMAVFMNKNFHESNKYKWHIIITGVVITFFIYELIGLIIYYFRDYIVHFIVSSPLVKESSINYIKYAAPSYGVFGSVISLLTMLEQIGYGYIVLTFNIVFFAMIFFIGKYLIFTHHTYISFYQVIAYSNYVAGMIIVGTFLLYKKRFS